MISYFPVVTGSLSVSGSVNISGGITASGGITISGSIDSASYAATASSADNLLVRNTLTAQTLVVQTITSSVDFVTGSTRFGSISANTHQFTGSMGVSGSGTFSDNVQIGGANTSTPLGIKVGTNKNFRILDNSGAQLDVVNDALDTRVDFRIGGFNYFLANGNVGIGTGAADSKLHVAGNIRVGASLDNSSTFIGKATATTEAFRNMIKFVSTTTDDYLQFGTHRSGVSSDIRMTIDAIGNVGIGTASPNSLFEINKSSNAGSGASFPRVNVINSLATQGDGSSTYNFADIHISSGNGAVDMYMSTTYAAGTWAPQGIINVATNHPLAFKTNNTERMRIFADGVMSIGMETNQYSRLAIKSNSTTRYAGLNLYAPGNGNFIFLNHDNNVAWVGTEFGTGGTGATPLGFAPGGIERMRIATNGDITLGITSGYDTAIIWKNDFTGTTNGRIYADGTPRVHVRCAESGGVYLSGGATSWTGNSDERLKDINGIIENAVDKINTLRAVNFSWKSDENKKEVLGLIAQDVKEVFPQTVDEDKEGIMGVRYTELVPVLVKAIQELNTKFEDYKATHP